MIQILINRQPLLLPKDFEFDFFESNPFFTKKGDFTYDIDVPLNNPTNTMILGPIQRLDITQKVIQYNASMLIDNIYRIEGSAVILSVSDNIAKLQLLIGNSELNYINANDKKIRELDLGAFNFSTQAALETLNKVYPDSDCVFCPVVKQKGKYNAGVGPGVLKNDLIYNEIYRNTKDEAMHYVNNAEFAPQPYLLAMIDKVVAALGYTIGRNDITNDELNKRMIIVNGLKAYEYNRIIPNWAINDFITEIEKLFNVIFLVHSTSKVVEIVNVRNYYQEAATTIISADDVLDNFEKKYGQSESLYLTYKNVQYKLNSNRYYKYACLDNEIRQKAQVREAATYADITKINEEDIKKNLLKSTDNGLSYILSRVQDDGDTYRKFEIVDMLRNIEDPESDDKTEFKIIPAEVTDDKVLMPMKTENGDNYAGWVSATLPVVSNVNDVEVKDYLFQEVEEGIEEPETTTSNLFITLYRGCKPYEIVPLNNNNVPDLNQYIYPQCCNYPYMIFYWGPGANSRLSKIEPDNFTLALRGQYGMFAKYYDKAVNVDTSKEYVIQFRSKKKLDPKSIFIIASKKFYCKELHYKVTHQGLSDIVEGIFYPM